MSKVKGLFVLLEMIPFLGNITLPKPESKWYKNTWVNTRKYKKRAESSYNPEKFAVTRFCDFCHEEFVAIRKNQFFCKKECQSKWIYEQNKNPLSLHVGGQVVFSNDSGYNEEYRVPSEILAQAELYTDCGGDAEFGSTGAFFEDMEDLHMILRSEYALSEARYEKRAKAKYSGKSYWEVKMVKNFHRKQVGLENLPSIRYSNFELKSIRHQQEKRGEINKLKLPTEAQIENPGFATITPMKTKSGKSIAEILDKVQRKKFITNS